MQSDDFFQITSEQLRAARALLRWSAEDLAGSASVGIATIRRAEARDGVLSTTRANTAALRRALEEAGVEFTPSDDAAGFGVGVRFNSSRPQAGSALG